MSQELKVLREQLARVPRNGRGYRRYTEELKSAVASYGARGEQRGESYTDMAKKLGLPAATMLNWRGKERKAATTSKHPVGFRPVTVQDKPAEENARVSRPVVVLPGGIRVEGMTTGDITELLRGLS